METKFRNEKFDIPITYRLLKISQIYFEYFLLQKYKKNNKIKQNNNNKKICFSKILTFYSFFLDFVGVIR